MRADHGNIHTGNITTKVTLSSVLISTKSKSCVMNRWSVRWFPSYLHPPRHPGNIQPKYPFQQCTAPRHSRSGLTKVILLVNATQHLIKKKKNHDSYGGSHNFWILLGKAFQIGGLDSCKGSRDKFKWDDKQNQRRIDFCYTTVFFSFFPFFFFCLLSLWITG